jgi:hypothetical protein
MVWTSRDCGDYLCFMRRAALTALANSLPWLTTAQSWHTQSESVTFWARGKRTSILVDGDVPSTRDCRVRAPED